MSGVSDPKDYEWVTINIRRDLWRALQWQAEKDDIGVSRVLEEFLEIFGPMPNDDHDDR